MDKRRKYLKALEGMDTASIERMLKDVLNNRLQRMIDDDEELNAIYYAATTAWHLNEGRTPYVGITIL